MSDLLEPVAAVLRRFPEIAVFLTLGLGHLLGKYKVKGVGLGTVVGTLVVGMIIGQAHVEIPTFARTLFFLLFMFATGYHVGPQFFVSLRRGGMQLVILSLVFAVIGLGATLLVSWFLGLDAGMAGGLLSGSLTQSSVIGTASDAIMQLPLPEEQKARLVNHVPIADAVTYLFGTIGVTLLLTKVFPAIMGVNLRDESAAFEKELGAALQKADDQPGFQVAIYVDVQAMRLTQPSFVGKTVAEVEQLAAPRVQVARLRRGGGHAFPPGKDFVLAEGDIIVLSGPREDLIKIGPLIGEQVVDIVALQVPFHTRTVIITNRKAVGRALSELRALDELHGRGVHLRRVTRQGEPLPMLPRTVTERGDALDLIGTKEDLDRVTPLLGVADIPTDMTSFVAMGITIAIGALAGIVAIHLGPVPVGLGTGGGVLIAGLAFGWLQSHRPSLGRIPNASVWLMENLGLNAFVAMVGLAAGPHAVEALKSSGAQLLLASVVVATIPHFATFLLGRYAFGLNAAQLMGALAGAGTVTASLQSLVDESDSSVPVLGYTVPYAINNILLTAWGPVVVAVSQFWATP